MKAPLLGKWKKKTVEPVNSVRSVDSRELDSLVTIQTKSHVSFDETSLKKWGSKQIKERVRQAKRIAMQNRKVNEEGDDDDEDGNDEKSIDSEAIALYEKVRIDEVSTEKDNSSGSYYDNEQDQRAIVHTPIVYELDNEDEDIVEEEQNGLNKVTLKPTATQEVQTEIGQKQMREYEDIAQQQKTEQKEALLKVTEPGSEVNLVIEETIDIAVTEDILTIDSGKTLERQNLNRKTKLVNELQKAEIKHKGTELAGRLQRDMSLEDQLNEKYIKEIQRKQSDQKERRASKHTERRASEGERKISKTINKERKRESVSEQKTVRKQFEYKERKVVSAERQDSKPTKRKSGRQEAVHQERNRKLVTAGNQEIEHESKLSKPKETKGRFENERKWLGHIQKKIEFISGRHEQSRATESISKDSKGKALTGEIGRTEKKRKWWENMQRFYVSSLEGIDEVEKERKTSKSNESKRGLRIEYWVRAEKEQRGSASKKIKGESLWQETEQTEKEKKLMKHKQISSESRHKESKMNLLTQGERVRKESRGSGSKETKDVMPRADKSRREHKQRPNGSLLGGMEEVAKEINRSRHKESRREPLVEERERIGKERIKSNCKEIKSSPGSSKQANTASFYTEMITKDTNRKSSIESRSQKGIGKSKPSMQRREKEMQVVDPGSEIRVVKKQYIKSTKIERNDSEIQKRGGSGKPSKHRPRESKSPIKEIFDSNESTLQQLTKMKDRKQMKIKN